MLRTWTWIGTLAHLALSGDGSRLRSIAAGEEATAYYEYSHHGQEWAMGSCASRSRQSPINFADVSAAPSAELAYAYQPVASPFVLINTGHSYSADLSGLGYGGITYDNAYYSLLNINVHSQSEHTLAGVRKPMELQLVHKRYDSAALLIVAVLVDCASPPPALVQRSAVRDGTAARTPSAGTRRSPFRTHAQMSALGQPLVALPPMTGMAYMPPPATDANFNPFVQAFLKVALPPKHMKVTVPMDEASSLDLNALMEGATFLEYAGSLTSPPCAELVTWFVRREPVMASDEQVRRLHDAIFGINAAFGNYRSVMPLNGRTIIVRSAVAESVPMKSEEVKVPLDPSPQTDREFQAMKLAEDAMAMARTTVDHVNRLDGALRGGAEAHLNALEPAKDAPPNVPHAVEAMGAKIAEAAREAIAGAMQELSNETKRAADAAASDAAKMVVQAMLHAPPLAAASPAAPAAGPSPAAVPVPAAASGSAVLPEPAAALRPAAASPPPAPAPMTMWSPAPASA